MIFAGALFAGVVVLAVLAVVFHERWMGAERRVVDRNAELQRLAQQHLEALDRKREEIHELRTELRELRAVVQSYQNPQATVQRSVPDAEAMLTAPANSHVVTEETLLQTVAQGLQATARADGWVLPDEVALAEARRMIAL
jgi:type II secretory pathway component PulM